ncbi:Mini-ribonuclease 3 [Paenibacillus sp. J2TS4]|uniref:Mini-ribonuclease 3 n=1 Tax=Paenibacillus sp. J2TS4 TaxID=2807194 RepID=UPI001B16521F|nr:Mini-ribonuclease 3 [Paenibacillus sp. J2TS4]GIP36238.1 mini-ribonuclease 3 [Paenibacillus sp. J2TS4]
MNDSMTNHPLFTYPGDNDPKLMNPLVLAYIGDAVYELTIRQHLASLANYRPNQLHKQATRYVSAKAQARALEQWQSVLTEEEADVVRRGRNAKSGTAPKNTDILVYRHSTALECLVGYLYCQGRLDRLHQLINLGLEGGDPPSSGKL